MNERTQHFYEFGGYRIEREERLLERGGEVIALPPKAVELLFVLLESGGRVLTKDELMSLVWVDSFVEESNLSQNIFLLRKVLGGGKNGGGKFIETIPRRGYRFVAEVRQADREAFIAQERTLTQIVFEEEIEIEDDPQKIIEAKTSPPTLPSTYKQHEDENTSQIKRRKSTIAGGLVVLLIAAMGFGYWFYTVRSAATKQISSIAVMPFTNESGSEDAQYLSDGVTETLISSLSQISNLGVKPSSVMNRYKGKDVSAATVGQELNVGAVLYGRMVQHGPDLTVFLSLVDTKTEYQIWGKQYVKKLNGLAQLQDEIGRDIAQSLSTRLTPPDESRLARNYSKNGEAYRLYLLGRFYWNKFTAEGLTKSIECFEQAIALDGNYALAYTGLANSYTVLGVNGHMPVKDARPKAKAAAEMAVALDGNLSEVRTALDAYLYFFEWNLVGSENELKRAIELDPTNAGPHELLAYVMRVQRRMEEALVSAKKATDLNPTSLVVVLDLATFYRYSGDLSEALKGTSRIIEMDPNFADVHSENGFVLSQYGLHDRAIEEMKLALALSDNSTHTRSGLGQVYARAGRRSEAYEVIGEMISASEKRYVSPLDVALIYSTLDDRDKAFVWLEKSFEDRACWLIEMNVEPAFEPIRNDPRFHDLARRVGLDK